MGTRFFKVELAALNAIRTAVMIALDQPNGRADEPWPEGGTLNDGTHGYVAIGDHQPELLAHLVDAEGVEEIDEEAYFAAMPQESYV